MAGIPPPFLHRASMPATSAGEADFLRNLSNTRGFSQHRSQAQNPKWRRHASLDAGVGQIRSRMNSAYGEGQYSPLSAPGYGPEEEKRLLYDFPSPLSPWGTPTRPLFEPQRSKTKLVLGAVVLLLVGALGAVFLLNRPDADDWWGVRSRLEDYGIKFDHATCENPYAAFGRITVDQTVPESNRWIPYDPTCSPPQLMAALRSALRPSMAGRPLRSALRPSMAGRPLQLPLPKQRPARNASLPLPWLHGKTVVLFGDHVERLHNKDFCRFAGGQFASIGAEHPLSPPRFVNGIDEKWAQSSNNHEGSRPSVCYVEQYDFTVVSVFHFGLATRPEFERENLLTDPYFYPPVALDDRLSHILLPILNSLDRTHPDLVEFSSGFWDLRHFTALDELAGLDPFSDLNSDRLEWYSSRLHQAFNDLGSTFPKTPLLWRSLHHTPKFANTPYSRVAALDQLSRKVVKDLNLAKRRESLDGSASATKIKGFKGQHREDFIGRVKGRIGKDAQKVQQAHLGEDEVQLKGLVRVDEWGSLMLGQQHLMNNVHTPPLPGGFLWGDIMLFELRRAVLGPAASHL